MSRGRPVRVERDELVSALILALFFFMVLAGRELGDIYSSYKEVSQLSIVFHVKEEELAGFVREVLAGGDADLEVGLAFSLTGARSIEGLVPQVPDYVRRWFISVTLSPILVKQAEVSEVEVQVWVEGELMLEESFPFEAEGVPYARLLGRNLSLAIEDAERFRRVVREASERYGGEVEFRFTGLALVHVRFLKVWLPFFTERYPLVRAPHLGLLSSNWTDADGLPVTRVSVGRDTYVSVHLRNPTRVHSIWEDVNVTIYRAGSAEPVLTRIKEAGVAPGTTATYVFPFSPEEHGVYRYTLEAPGGLRLDESSRLRVDPAD